jgi:hypothetical protein
MIQAVLRVTVIALCAIPTWAVAVEPKPLDAGLGKADEKGPLVWFDIRDLGIEGQGFRDTKAPYDRLPARAEGKVRDAVWNLSRDSAGMCVRFVTDSPAVHCRWTLTKANLAMPHMAATGVSGVDLYVKTDRGWRWVACGRPTAQSNNAALISGIAAGRREWLLYLPLYNGVSSVEIGIGKPSQISPLPRESSAARPIVFYGTSITHGACASRPGMVHTAILGRRLDRPVINLGFSGNGRMETEVVELINEIDAEMYVIDCLPNMTAAEVTERTGPLVALLRKEHPNTPIVLVEDRTYADAHINPAKRERNDSSRIAFKAEYDKLVAAGVKGLSYIPGEHLLGDDDEGTVDSSHPTDLGFVRQADAMETVMRPLLKRGGD